MRIARPGHDDPAGVAHPRSRRLRAIAVLPTMATLGNLICGFTAIHFCMRSMFATGGKISPLLDATANRAYLFERMLPSYLAMACYVLVLAMIFDALDGRLARLARKTTTFGGQLDSLADMVSFGLAPAVMILTLLTRQVEGEWLVTPLGDKFGRAAWLMAGAYVACTALRLARFNVENEPDESAHKFFKGLPSPGAACVILSFVLLHESLFRQEFNRTQGYDSAIPQVLVKSLPVIALLLGLAMISRLRYVHVGNLLLRGRRPVPQVLLIAAMLATVILWPEVSLAIYVTLFALSGPVLAVVRRFRPARAEAIERAAMPDTGTGAARGRHGHTA